MFARRVVSSLSVLAFLCAFAFMTEVHAISIRGTVWCAEADADCGRGMAPGPVRLPGVELALCDENGDPIFDKLDNDNPITTIADANGDHIFENLFFRADRERVIHVVKITSEVPGKVLGSINCLNTEVDEDLLTNGCIPSDRPMPSVCGETSLANRSIEIFMPSFLVTRCNTLITGIDFVYCADSPPCTGRLGDQVWLDLDGDSIKDADELGIEGVRMVLCDAAGGELADTLTDVNDLYHFDGLCAGDHLVKIDDSTVPSGLERCECGVGDNRCSPAPATLASDSDEDLTLDFCFKEPPPPPSGGEGCTPG
jgi:hypothetical protein